MTDDGSGVLEGVKEPELAYDREIEPCGDRTKGLRGGGLSANRVVLAEMF